MSFSSLDFRKALGSFTTGICNITTYKMQTKTPIGMTINSLSSVSLSPPLLLFCLDKKSHAMPYFQENEFFCVNILSAEQKEISIRFSDGTKDPWALTSHHLKDSHFIYVDQSLVHIQCKTKTRIEQGDHIIMIGEVLKTDFHPDEHKKPLIYQKRHYLDF